MEAQTALAAKQKQQEKVADAVENRKSVAIIGDGSMTAGMAFEAGIGVNLNR